MGSAGSLSTSSSLSGGITRDVAAAARGFAPLPNVSAARGAIVQLLTGEWMKHVYAHCESVPALADLLEREKISAPLVDDTGHDFAEPGLRRVIAAGAEVQILAAKALALTPQRSPPMCVEFIRLAATAIGALPDLWGSHSRASLRVFKRCGLNIADIIETLYLAKDAPAREFAGFKAAQWEALLLGVHAIGAFAHIIASRVSTPLADSWRLVQTQQLPWLADVLSSLSAKARALLAANNKPREGETASAALAAVDVATAQLFESAEWPDLSAIARPQAAVAGALGALCEALFELSDATGLAYDPDSAGKLPAHYGLPPTPSDISLKPQIAAADVLTAIHGIYAAFPVFKGGLLVPAPNASLIALAHPFYDQVTDLLSRTLHLSVVSVSIANQLALTAAASTLAKAIDVVNRGLRAKFLANPAWETTCERGLDEFAGAIPGLAALADAARRIADDEDAKHGETRAKVLAALAPLRAVLPALDGNVKALAGREASPAREFAVILTNLAKSGATLMGRILLYAKEQGREGEALEPALAVAGQVLAIAEDVRRYAEGKLPGLEAMAGSAGALVEALARAARDVDAGTAEGAELRGQAGLVGDGARAFQAAVRRSVEQPPVTVAKARAKPAAKVESAKPADERLMDRLQLEAQVNMWRWRLQFLEKELADLGS